MQPLDMKAIQAQYGPQSARTIDPKILEIFAKLPDYIQHVLKDNKGVEKIVPNSQLKNILLLAKDDPKIMGYLANYFTRNTLKTYSTLPPTQLYKISINDIFDGKNPLAAYMTVAQGTPAKPGEVAAAGAAVKPQVVGAQGGTKTEEAEGVSLASVRLEIDHDTIWHVFEGLKAPDGTLAYKAILDGEVDLV